MAKHYLKANIQGASRAFVVGGNQNFLSGLTLRNYLLLTMADNKTSTRIIASAVFIYRYTWFLTPCFCGREVQGCLVPYPFKLYTSIENTKLPRCTLLNFCWDSYSYKNCNSQRSTIHFILSGPDFHDRYNSDCYHFHTWWFLCYATLPQVSVHLNGVSLG